MWKVLLSVEPKLHNLKILNESELFTILAVLGMDKNTVKDGVHLWEVSSLKLLHQYLLSFAPY